jgi:hypothetical protein
MNTQNNRSNEFSPWVFRILSWLIAVIAAVAYLVQKGATVTPPQTWLDGTFLWVFFLFLVLPFFQVVRLGKILELERGLKKTSQEVNDLRLNMSVLAANLSATASSRTTVNIVGQGIEPHPEQLSSPSGVVMARTAAELKVLNTLWIFQVDKFPDLMPRFTFRVDPQSAEYPSYQLATNKLLFEGLIAMNEALQVFLTDVGLVYCADNYPSFPMDAWFPPTPLDPQKIALALNAIKKSVPAK